MPNTQEIPDEAFARAPRCRNCGGTDLIATADVPCRYAIVLARRMGQPPRVEWTPDTDVEIVMADDAPTLCNDCEHTGPLRAFELATATQAGSP